MLDSDNFTEGSEENEGGIARELGELTRKDGCFSCPFVCLVGPPPTEFCSPRYLLLKTALWVTRITVELNMKISYDPEVDALSITFHDRTVTTKHLAEGIAAG